MNDKKNFWVFVEQENGRVKPSSLEVIHVAKTLAEKSEGKVTALYPGFNGEQETEILIQYGADRILLLLNSKLTQFTSSAFLEAILPVIREEAPYSLLLSATNHGRELAPALAAALGSGQATDCIAIELDRDGLKVQRPVYSATAHSTLLYTGSCPHIVTLRPRMFHNAKPDTSRKGEIEKQEVKLKANSLLLKIKNVITECDDEMDITKACIVAAGGLGMQRKENFKLLDKLAHVLGAAIGASRPVIDRGWKKYSCQVGVSGRIISPDLYIACGISGTFQHLGGMSSCKCVVAINTDPQAPIFSIADYGIVGDAMEVLPILTEEFKKVLSV